MMFTAMTKPEEWNWATERAGCRRLSDTQGVVAYDNKARIKAVAVFDRFLADCCSVHLAIDNPIVIRSGFLTEVAEHLFVRCNLDRLFGMVPSDNEKALKFNKHIGFHEVTRIPDACGKGIAMVVMRMDKAGCRWIIEQEQEKVA
jgi:hypothetical protein